MHRGSGITAITGHRHSMRGEKRRSRRQKREPSVAADDANPSSGQRRRVERRRSASHSANTPQDKQPAPILGGGLEALTPASTPAPARSGDWQQLSRPRNRAAKTKEHVGSERRRRHSHRITRSAQRAARSRTLSERKHDGREEDSTLS